MYKANRLVHGEKNKFTGQIEIHERMDKLVTLSQLCRVDQCIKRQILANVAFTFLVDGRSKLIHLSFFRLVSESIKSTTPLQVRPVSDKQDKQDLLIEAKRYAMESAVANQEPIRILRKQMNAQ